MRIDAVERSRKDRAELVRELEAAGAKFKGNECTCPFHDDNHPSAGIFEQDGIWRFKCQTIGCGVGGDIFDIRAKLSSRPLVDVLREARGEKPKTNAKAKVHRDLDDVRRALPGRIVSEHVYANVAGETLFVVFRCEADGGKTYRPAHPTADGGWLMSMPPKPWPIYALPIISPAARVVLVEGERCADAMNRLGIPATTAPCGAGKGQYADWSALAGKSIVLWPDNDASGASHMDEVAAILQRLQPPASVARVDVTALGLASKGDVADLANRLRDDGKSVPEIANEIREIIDAATYTGPLTDLADEYEKVAAGLIRTIPWPWPMLTDFTEALAPGKVTLISGTPGSGKSLFVLQCVIHWLDRGESVVYFCLEGTRNDHLRRGLAQLAGESGVTKNRWSSEHIERIRAWQEEYVTELSRLTSALETTESCPAETLDQLADWTRSQAKAGKRIVIIDPITMAERTEKPWIADKKFLRAVGRIAGEYGASVILVTHPTNGGQDADLGNVAGGEAYKRFTDTIITVSIHKDGKQADVKTDLGIDANCAFNQTVRMVKARYAEGAALAYRFSEERRVDGQRRRSLKTSELGIIIAKKK